MEVILLDAEPELSYVSSSGVDYPSLPYDNPELAEKIVSAARRGKELLSDFKVPERKEGEGLRGYQSRVADMLESHLSAAFYH